MPTGPSGPKTSPSDLTEFLAQTREAVNRCLERWCDRVEHEIGGGVGAAIGYSLRAPGKRFRPALLLAAYRVLGGTGDATELAVAVEVVHTYSLVHDDLPCMDNDDWRRGRPTTHRQFDVQTATEAGFLMVPLAGQVLAAGAARLGLEGDAARALARELFRAAGAAGMVGGQVLDLEAEGQSVGLDELVRIHRAKTGALIAVSAVMGAMAAGAPPSVVETMRAYGFEIGLAFQITDDVLDATATSTELGKTAGKDAVQRKATFATILGVPAAREAAQRHASGAVDLLRPVGLDSSLLRDLAMLIVERRS